MNRHARWGLANRLLDQCPLYLEPDRRKHSLLLARRALEWSRSLVEMAPLEPQARSQLGGQLDLLDQRIQEKARQIQVKAGAAGSENPGG